MFAIYCISEAKYLYQGELLENAALEIEGFSIQRINHSSFMVQKDKRKHIFHLNEIFSFDYSDYFITEMSSPIHMIHYSHQSSGFFCLLIENNILKYLKEIFANFLQIDFSLKKINFKKLSKISLSILIIIFSLGEKNISADDLSADQNIERSQAFYQTASQLFQQAKSTSFEDEISNQPKIVEKVNSLNQTNEQNRVTKKINPILPAKNKSKIHSIYKGHDQDVEYFLNLKKRKK